MVTTTAQQQTSATELFKEAMRKLREEVTTGDMEEKEVLATFREAFSTAVEGLVPALKLVDESLYLGKPVRGVRVFGTGQHMLFLLRGGGAGLSWAIDPSSPVDRANLLKEIEKCVAINSREDPAVVPMNVIAELLAMLTSIEALVSRAKENNEKRHMKLQQLLDGLNKLGKPQEQPQA